MPVQLREIHLNFENYCQVIKTFQDADCDTFLNVRQTPGARFSKAPESFRARKAIFISSVSKNREVYKLESSCMKGTSFHL